MRFVLASASPARLKTLRAAGVEPEVIVSGVDESAIAAESPADLAGVLAEHKARAVAALLDGSGIVLGCDSLLEFDGEALGKPGTVELARQRWRSMRGKSATLHTGHFLLDLASGRAVRDVVATHVRFADVSDAEIDAYCETGEPVGVAGAFTVDGLGGWFVEGVDGDPHNVVGVSLPVLRRLLIGLGYGLTDIGYPAPR
ncbi:MAG TPA: nucleoside triphosphate pyrophosphatase [Jatrophihabitans sp.]|nr:nucleoside triphosphate pyrophosphatase [Jatrophihabitans sp.]